VTLYGLIENGVDFVNNSAGHTYTAMKDGAYTGIYGSRWGLVGREELGGGLAAIFRIESGFNTQNGALGQGGLAFGRQAYVGLQSKDVGTVTAGRQYDSVVDFLQFAGTGSQVGGIATHASDIDNVGNSFRVNNAIKYMSPILGGVRVSGLVSLTDSQASNGPGRFGTWSAGGDYTYGGLHVAAAYLYAREPAQQFADGHFVANTVGDAIGANGPWSYVGNPDNERILGVGATYAFSSLTLAGLYTRTKFDGANGTQGTVAFDNYDVSFRYLLTPAWKLIGGYLYTAGRIGYLNQKIEFHRVAAGIDYSLSKRTEVYAVVAAQQATGDAKGADLYQGTEANMSSTNRQTGVRVAIIHRF